MQTGPSKGCKEPKSRHQEVGDGMKRAEQAKRRACQDRDLKTWTKECEHCQAAGKRTYPPVLLLGNC